MNSRNKAKVLSLFALDIVALYASLFAALAFRYGSGFYGQFISFHASPFTIIFGIWLIVFYTSGLYDLRRLRNNLYFFKTLTLAIFINSALATAFFYFLPTFGIAPKTNLFIFIVIFAFIEFFARRFFNKFAASGEAPNKVLLIGNSKTSDEVFEFVAANPQFGYEIAARLHEEAAHGMPSIYQAIANHKINVVVVPRHPKRSSLANELYKLLSRGVEIHDLASFYELIMRKIPIAEIDETWFLEHLVNRPKFYGQIKRGCEVLCAIFLQIVALPLEIFVVLISKITSPGPAIYKQARIGKNNKEFTLYKFRTMKLDAEKNGAQWSGTEDDPVTLFGKLLRRTHLDELPQLINIIEGNLSFVGPRPERPEFVKILKEKIPYFEVRNLVLPGVTGWAQINHHYNATDADSYENLQHDIYYIKNGSIILDLAIIIKTAKSLFVNQ